MLDVHAFSRRGAFALEAQLQVSEGVTALIGASGAGKSSLLRIIAGLDRPAHGFVRLNNRLLSDTASGQFVSPESRGIGMVFQRPALLPHLGVKRNIALGSRGEISDEILARTGCEALLDRPVSALSGGEQQRVMLARALVSKPKLLLLDEPLSALDDKASASLLSLLAEIVPGLDIPVLYVTHDMEEAGQLASRFALMAGGKVVKTGSSSEVLPAHGRDAERGISGVLQGKVLDVGEDGLARISAGGGVVEVSGDALAMGDMVALRLWARDIMLARSVPDGISARNALKARIVSLKDRAGGQVEVMLSLGDGQVPAIVMARTVADMGLAKGQITYAVFKSASVERMI